MGLFEMVKTKKRLVGAQQILFNATNEASPKHFIIVAEVKDYTTTTGVTMLTMHPCTYIKV